MAKDKEANLNDEPVERPVSSVKSDIKSYKVLKPIITGRGKIVGGVVQFNPAVVGELVKAGNLEEL